MTAYLGLSQGSRAPSSIELGCADPENPCRLPNSMAGDPPLDAVVTRTVEAGLRGKLAGDFTYLVTPVFMNAADELSYGEPQQVAIQTLIARSRSSSLTDVMPDTMGMSSAARKTVGSTPQPAFEAMCSAMR